MQCRTSAANHTDQRRQTGVLRLCRCNFKFWLNTICLPIYYMITSIVFCFRWTRLCLLALKHFWLVFLFFAFQCLVVDFKCIAWIVLRFYKSISFQRSSPRMPIFYHGYATQAVFYCCYLYRSVKMLENSLEMRLCELRSREKEYLAGWWTTAYIHIHNKMHWWSFATTI